MKISLFKNLITPVVEKAVDVDLFSFLSEPYEVVDDAKRYHPAWSAAEFEDGIRANDSVLSTAALVLDYDKQSIRLAKMKWRGWYYILHTTRSHCWLSNHFRLVLPLKDKVDPSVYARLFLWAQDRDGAIDSAARDPSRAWLRPVVNMWYEQTVLDYRCFIGEGPLLDVSQLNLPVLVDSRLKASGYRSRRVRRNIADRLKLGEELGGLVSSTLVRGLECPDCGRCSVWYWIDPKWMSYAQCNRKASCAWFGDIRELAGEDRIMMSSVLRRQK